MVVIERDGMAVSKLEEMVNPVPLAMMFPDARIADIEALRSWHGADGLDVPFEDITLALSVHSFVLSMNGKTILVDGCNGNDKTRSIPFADHLRTDYLDRLAHAGVRPEDVDIVMCTHLHCDHVGWNTRLLDGRWVPTFPNARYLFSRADYDHFRDPASDALHREAFQDSVLPIVDAGLAELVEPGGAVADAAGLWIDDASGHSPGSVLLRAGKTGRELIFAGDVMHHPLQIARPSLNTPFDHDPARAIAVRRALLEACADTDRIVLPAHFEGCSAGSIHRDGDDYRMEALHRCPAAG